VQDFVHQQDVPANTAFFSMCFFVKEGPKLFGGSGQRLDLNSSRSSRLSFVKEILANLKQFVKKFFLPFVKCSQLQVPTASQSRLLWPRLLQADKVD